MLKDRYGILLLLYSIIVTKGVTEIRSEMSDPLESMIDSTYGYGNQSLINLMLTGRAVSHVWDHDQDIGGLSKIFLYFILYFYILFLYFILYYMWI